MKVWRHHLFNYLLFTILHKYNKNITKFKSSKRQCKQQKQLWILFHTFRKMPERKFAGQFSVKLLPTNMGFANYSGLKFSQDFQNTEAAFWRCSTKVFVHKWMLWWNIYTFAAMVQSWSAFHANLLKIALCHRYLSKNFSIEKCIFMAASEDNFISKIFLNGCFSRTPANIYLF